MIQSYFRSKLQIPKELAHWRNFIQGSEVNDEAMMIKTTASIEQRIVEEKLSDSLKSFLTKEWKGEIISFVKEHVFIMEVVPCDEEDTVYIKILREAGKKKCLKEDELQRICDNMDMHLMSMHFKPNFRNELTALLPFLQKKCQVASPTKIKTGLFRKTPVIKLQLGIDTLMELNRNKEQVHQDDKFLIMKLATLH